MYLQSVVHLFLMVTCHVQVPSVKLMGSSVTKSV